MEYEEKEEIAWGIGKAEQKTVKKAKREKERRRKGGKEQRRKKTGKERND